MPVFPYWLFAFPIIFSDAVNSILDFLLIEFGFFILYWRISCEVLTFQMLIISVINSIFESDHQIIK